MVPNLKALSLRSLEKSRSPVGRESTVKPNNLLTYIWLNEQSELGKSDRKVISIGVLSAISWKRCTPSLLGDIDQESSILPKNMNSLFREALVAFFI